MPDTLFDPSVHLSLEPLDGYKFDHNALAAKISELKEHPTDKMKAFLESHSEYKHFSCAALAEYSGLSEPTLKKLKSGQIADPRGSTFWILYNKFGIKPRDVLKCIPASVCNLECANQAKLELKGTQMRIKDLEAELADIKAAHAKQLADEQERTRRSDTTAGELWADLKRTRRVLLYMCIALVAVTVAATATLCICLL